MLVRYHLQSRTSIQNSTGEEEHRFTSKCYQRHSQMRIPEELVPRSFCRRLVPFCRASSRNAGPKFPMSKFSRILRRGNRSSRNRFALCVCRTRSSGRPEMTSSFGKGRGKERIREVDLKRAERKIKRGKESVGTWRRIPNG